MSVLLWLLLGLGILVGLAILLILVFMAMLTVQGKMTGGLSRTRSWLQLLFTDLFHPRR